MRQAAYTFDAGPNCVIYARSADVPGILALVNHYLPSTHAPEDGDSCVVCRYIKVKFIKIISYLGQVLSRSDDVKRTRAALARARCRHESGATTRQHQVWPFDQIPTSFSPTILVESLGMSSTPRWGMGRKCLGTSTRCWERTVCPFNLAIRS